MRKKFERKKLTEKKKKDLIEKAGANRSAEQAFRTAVEIMMPKLSAEEKNEIISTLLLK